MFLYSTGPRGGIVLNRIGLTVEPSNNKRAYQVWFGADCIYLKLNALGRNIHTAQRVPYCLPERKFRDGWQLAGGGLRAIHKFDEGIIYLSAQG